MTLNSYEAFYYLGLYGSVTEAAKYIPSSSTPSAVSMLIKVLEKHYDTPLYIRRPFALTAAGEKVFAYCQITFEGLAALDKELLAKNVTLNIGGPEVLLRKYLDDEINLMREKFPQAQVNLRDGDQASLEEALIQQKVNVAVTIFDKKPNKRLRSFPLLHLPLALVVPTKSKWKSAEQVFAAISRRDIGTAEKFLMLPPKHAITQNFWDGLKGRGIKDVSISEYDTTDLIESYVLKGGGIGVSVMAPGAEKIKGLHFLPLSAKEFAPVTLGLLWQEPATPQVTAFIEAVKAKAKKV
jgi:DNA-binding transcriptional LysR family regulator